MILDTRWKLPGSPGLNLLSCRAYAKYGTNVVIDFALPSFNAEQINRYSINNSSGFKPIG